MNKNVYFTDAEAQTLKVVCLSTGENASQLIARLVNQEAQRISRNVKHPVLDEAYSQMIAARQAYDDLGDKADIITRQRARIAAQTAEQEYRRVYNDPANWQEAELELADQIDNIKRIAEDAPEVSF